MSSINELCIMANATARDKGFWEGHDTFKTNTHLVKLALIVSEVGEAIEAVRRAEMENYSEELADICIRIFDLCGETGIDLERAIVDKMHFNQFRPQMHGKLA